VRLNDYRDRNDLFFEWILENTPKDTCSILDIGANDGAYCPEVSWIAAHARTLAGVDPDRAKLERNPFVSERYYATLEDADIPSESFDVLYSIFVFEHVIDEDRFVAAASRILKPGGSMYFITPNGHHYFAILSQLFSRLRMQRQVLGMVRTKELIESYHYPAVYRLNKPKDIERIGRKHGFESFEYRYSELYGELATYFPGPLKMFPRLWEQAVQATGREDRLLNLMGRMVKAA
jgi:ubiquinone/menaquinone biosynthesis C-methylase UbiE